MLDAIGILVTAQLEHWGLADERLTINNFSIITASALLLAVPDDFLANRVVLVVFGATDWQNRRNVRFRVVTCDNVLATFDKIENS